MGSFNENGKIDINTLKDNLNQTENVTGIDRIKTLPTMLISDGYQVAIKTNGQVVIEGENGELTFLDIIHEMYGELDATYEVVNNKLYIYPTVGGFNTSEEMENEKIVPKLKNLTLSEKEQVVKNHYAIRKNKEDISLEEATELFVKDFKIPTEYGIFEEKFNWVVEEHLYEVNDFYPFCYKELINDEYEMYIAVKILEAYDVEDTVDGMNILDILLSMMGIKRGETYYDTVLTILRN